MNKNTLSTIITSAVVVSSLSLAGCRDREPDYVAADPATTAPASTAANNAERSLEEGWQETKQAANEAWSETKNAAGEAWRETQEFAGGVSGSLQESWQRLGNATYDERNEVRAEMDESLTELDGEVESWGANRNRLSAEARQEWDEARENLREARGELRQRLDRMADASRDGWNELKQEVREASMEVQEAYQRLRTQAQQAAE